VTINRDEYDRMLELIDHYRATGEATRPTPGSSTPIPNGPDDPFDVPGDQPARNTTQPRPSGSGYNPLIYDPRLQVRVPKFSGKMEDYCAWRNRFDYTIAVREDSYAAKFLYLLDAVESVDSVQHLKLWIPCQNSYEEALKKLDSVYGQPALVMDTLLKRFRNLKAISTDDNTRALLDLLSQFEAAIATAKRLGRLAMYDDSLRTLIFDKLPAKYMEEVFRRIPSDQPPLEDILIIANERLQNAIRASRWRKPKEDRKPAINKKEPEKKAESKAPNLSLTSGPVCSYDFQAHTTESCTLTNERKMTIVADRGLCLICLKPGHRQANCPTGQRCTKCQRRHHSSLCGNNIRIDRRVNNRVLTPVPLEGSSSTEPEVTEPNVTLPKEPATNLCIGDLEENSSVLFKTFWFRTEQGHEGRGFIDEGAAVNCVTEEAVTLLQLTVFTGPTRTLLGFGQTSGVEYDRYAIIKFRGGPREYVTMTFLVVPFIVDKMYPVAPSSVTQLVPTEHRCHYRDAEGWKLAILVAISDFATLAGPITNVHNSDTHSYSYQTWPCGTLIFGGPKNPPASKYPMNLLCPPYDLIQEVEQADQEDEDRFVEYFLKDHVRTVENRIEVDVPMTGKYRLDRNYGKALKQMKQNVTRWKKTDLLGHVLKILRDWKEAGIIEPVSPTDRQDPFEHYLSYHVVVKMTSSTTKHRIVFNGSLQDRNGNSLNDFLFKGSTDWSIVRSLLEFRKGRYPLVGDLRQAFLMVQLARLYRNMFRFLWPDLNMIEIYRFVRVPFGTSASPFLLFVAICKIIELERKDHPELDDLIHKFYVDDLISSFDSTSERTKFQLLCERIFAKYGFTFGWSDTGNLKVLGLLWNTDTDQIQVPLPERTPIRTVRDLASFIPSIFDPMGYLEPIVAQFRRLFSLIWKECRSWDATISEEQQQNIDELQDYLYDQPTLIITPNHGIYGHSQHPMLQPIETVGEANSEHLHVQIRKKVHSFWNAWYSEYRDNLRHIQVGRQLHALQVGDKVLYMKGEISRTGQYPMGTVIHIYPGQDGNVRLVDLKMDTGVVIHKRSIRQLIHFSSQGPEVVAD